MGANVSRSGGGSNGQKPSNNDKLSQQDMVTMMLPNLVQMGMQQQADLRRILQIDE